MYPTAQRTCAKSISNCLAIVLAQLEGNKAGNENTMGSQCYFMGITGS